MARSRGTYDDDVYDLGILVCVWVCVLGVHGMLLGR